MLQCPDFQLAQTNFARLHEPTTSSPSENSNLSEDSSSSSSIEGVELFDSKLESDIALADSAGIRTLLVEQKKPIRRILPAAQFKLIPTGVHQPGPSDIRSPLKIRPFFNRGAIRTSIRLPRLLLASSSDAQFRRLSNEFKVDLQQPLNLNSTGIKVRFWGYGQSAL